MGNTVLPVGIPLSGLSKIPTSRFPEFPLGTVLGKATAERPDIQLASVDSEEQPDLMARCSVERVPTLIVCRNGAVAARKSGIMNPRELLAFYESAS